MNENNYYLNDLAIRLLICFLQKHIKHTSDIKNYHFDLPQFIIDVTKAVNELLVHLNCSQHLQWTADFVCRGRSSVDRDIKK